ncbi:LPS export ABC transporter periplasmic protein LptC [Candidatus Pelagibacter sp.]|nr:LPS export ABC transporter periplasmic protein LptC [Candidatus Pelagibacter sp.]
MSIKSLIQISILIIIFIILGSVYFQYFSKQKIDVNETNKKSQENAQKNLENRENNDVKNVINLDDSVNPDLSSKKKELLQMPNNNNNLLTNKQIETSETTDLVKDVEYLTKDKNGNIYKILASSGKTNKNDTNILDLENVRGEINSEKRSTIYIFSDFAEYNSSKLKSNFYSNVLVKYEDKQIMCQNLEINMDTNTAIAYNNVVVIDPKSIMKAGKITLDIVSKEIYINPEQNEKSKVKINSKY